MNPTTFSTFLGHCFTLCLLTLLNPSPSVTTTAENDLMQNYKPLIDNISAKNSTHTTTTTIATSADNDYKNGYLIQDDDDDDEIMKLNDNFSDLEEELEAKYRHATRNHHRRNNRDNKPHHGDNNNNNISNNYIRRKNRHKQNHRNHKNSHKRHNFDNNSNNNNFQGSEKTLTLTIPPKPRLVAMSHNSVLLRWRLPPSTPDCLPVTFIKIQYKEVPPRSPHLHHHHGGQLSKLWNTVEDDIAPSVNKYVVRKLKQGSTYVFRLAVVYSNSDNRHGPNSARFPVGGSFGNIKSPRFAPFIVELKALDAHSLRVTWQQSQEPYIKIQGFHLQYKEYHNNNNNNNNNKSSRVKNHTENDPKQPIENDHRNGYNNNIDDDDDDDDYEDGDGGDDNDNYNEIIIRRPAVLSHVIGHLRPKTQYSLRVRAYNREGSSAFSNVAVKETLALDDTGNSNKSHVPLQGVGANVRGSDEGEEEEEEHDDGDDDNDVFGGDDDDDIDQNYYADENGEREEDGGDDEYYDYGEYEGGDDDDDDFEFYHYDFTNKKINNNNNNNNNNVYRKPGHGGSYKNRNNNNRGNDDYYDDGDDGGGGGYSNGGGGGGGYKNGVSNRQRGVGTKDPSYKNEAADMFGNNHMHNNNNHNNNNNYDNNHHHASKIENTKYAHDNSINNNMNNINNNVNNNNNNHNNNIMVALKDYTALKSERVLLIVVSCILSFLLLLIILLFVFCIKKNYLLSIKLTKVPYKSSQNKQFNS